VRAASRLAASSLAGVSVGACGEGRRGLKIHHGGRARAGLLFRLAAREDLRSEQVFHIGPAR
jgi:hypothetical protein